MTTATLDTAIRRLDPLDEARHVLADGLETIVCYDKSPRDLDCFKWLTTERTKAPRYTNVIAFTIPRKSARSVSGVYLRLIWIPRGEKPTLPPTKRRTAKTRTPAAKVTR